MSVGNLQLLFIHKLPPALSSISISLAMALLSLRDVLFFCFCSVLHFIYRYRRRPVVPLPPTLPGWPIVGNAFQIPLTYPHVFYKELGQKLGKICFCGHIMMNV